MKPIDLASQISWGVRQNADGAPTAEPGSRVPPGQIAVSRNGDSYTSGDMTTTVANGAITAIKGKMIAWPYHSAEVDLVPRASSSTGNNAVYATFRSELNQLVHVVAPWMTANMSESVLRANYDRCSSDCPYELVLDARRAETESGSVVGTVSWYLNHRRARDPQRVAVHDHPASSVQLRGSSSLRDHWGVCERPSPVEHDVAIHGVLGLEFECLRGVDHRQPAGVGRGIGNRLDSRRPLRDGGGAHLQRVHPRDGVEPEPRYGRCPF